MRLAATGVSLFVVEVAISKHRSGFTQEPLDPPVVERYANGETTWVMVEKRYPHRALASAARHCRQGGRAHAHFALHLRIATSTVGPLVERAFPGPDSGAHSEGN